MSDHTLTPWRMDETDPPGQTVLSSMAESGPAKNQCKSVCWLIKASAGDAAFILRSANAHDDLVAALKEAQQALRGNEEKGSALRTIDYALAKAEAQS